MRGKLPLGRPATRVSRSTWRAFLACLPPEDDFLSRNVYRWIGFPFFAIATRVNARANHVTGLSLVLGILSGLAFVQGEYVWTLAAVALLTLALGADAVDGQVARYRQEASDFGRWLDSLSDVFKLIAIFVGISVGLYRVDERSVYLLLGMAALAHLFLAYYLMLLNKRFTFYQYKNAINLSGTRWLGLESSIYVFVSAFALADQLAPMLWVFLVVGAVPWALLILRAWQSRIEPGSG
jgi:phosphatidylglycerophosphate synthase